MKTHADFVPGNFCSFIRSKLSKGVNEYCSIESLMKWPVSGGGGAWYRSFFFFCSDRLALENLQFWIGFFMCVTQVKSGRIISQERSFVVLKDCEEVASLHFTPNEEVNAMPWWNETGGCVFFAKKQGQGYEAASSHFGHPKFRGKFPATEIFLATVLPLSFWGRVCADSDMTWWLAHLTHHFEIQWLNVGCRRPMSKCLNWSSVWMWAFTACLSAVHVSPTETGDQSICYVCKCPVTDRQPPMHPKCWPCFVFLKHSHGVGAGWWGGRSSRPWLNMTLTSYRTRCSNIWSGALWHHRTVTSLKIPSALVCSDKFEWGDE